ncbi:MAG: polyphosphate kinase 1 [Kiritimatiellia bacterium]|nr:polyphosphate kinase 1 [Kiritimatiellia bacterium]
MSKKNGKPVPLFNRELSWLEFNRRVLDEARDASVPVLERLKFLAITASNLDEFFMVRGGGLQILREKGHGGRDPSGLTVRQQLKAISSEAHRMVLDQYRVLRDLTAEMERMGIRRLDAGRLSPDQVRHAERVFEQEIFPLLTPQTLDPDEEFPAIAGLTPHLAIRHADPEAGKKSERLALISIPKTLPRFITLPRREAHEVVMVESLIAGHLNDFFPGRQILETAAFRVSRNADLSVREDLAADLLALMEDVLTMRRKSDCVRLEIDRHASAELIRRLCAALEVERQDLYRIPGPIDLSAFMSLTSVPGFEEARNESWLPQRVPEAPSGVSIFKQIAARDFMVFTPYQTFDPVVRFLDEAATDPDVLAIKQILYRTSRDSPIIAALSRAAGRGKTVTVLVELKARFDEARNIEWAKALEEAGVQVIYGVRNLKTHAKICIVLRREAGGIRRYLHFATGNYNEVTARLYTDIGYFTCRDDLAADGSQFFNTITARTQPQQYRALDAAPTTLRDRLLQLIESEAERSRQGQPAFILAKVNSLADPQIIRALYKASRAGVRIDLNVRGICCLRPGVKGLSETIRVVSVVDRFLEHARIIAFRHGGEPLVFISSADWMPRNLDKRIELLVPIADRSCCKRLIEIVRTGMRDNVKGRELQPDGSYRRAPGAVGGRKVRSQELFYRDAVTAAQTERVTRRSLFEPHRPPTR